MFEIAVVDGGIVKLTGRLDASQADRAQLVFRGLARPLTVDFSDLDYISSAGIGVIIEAYKRITDQGHSFRLVRLNPRIRAVFGYAGLDKVIPIE
jgi:anti-anti-sigma factor